MKVYVAGPYSAPSPDAVRANVQRALDAGLRLIQAGHSPFVPHLTHYLELRSFDLGITIGYEDWLRIDIAFLVTCDALLLLDRSPGADRETAIAHDHGLLIVRDIADLL